MSNPLNYINYFLSLACLALLIVLGSCEDDENKIKASEVDAEFKAEATTVMTGNTVTFNDQSSGDVTHWNWTFEGGTPGQSSLQNPTITYTEAGNFEVTLVVSNAAHTSVMKKSGYVEVTQSPQPVTAAFSADRVSVLSGESVTFTDESSGGPTAWAWEFIPESGSPLTSTDQNPVITFDNPGIYSVKLTASNSKYADEELRNAYLTVIDASSVAAAFSADTRGTFTGQDIAFTDASVGKVTQWEWTFEGGTPASSTEQNPVVTYNSAGTFKVTLVASSDSKSSTEERAGYITVVPEEGLLTFLPFNGSSHDVGPLNLDVSDGSGSVTYTGTDRNDEINATAVFTGSGALQIPAVAEKQLGTSAYTIGVWLKTASAQEMWIWQEGGSDSPDFAWFRINNNTTFRIYSFLPQKKGILNVFAEEGRGPLSDNQWHYVVCVRSETGMDKVYVDGILEHQKNNSVKNDLTNTLGFLIGGRDEAQANRNFYTGQLDDLVIYKRELSEAEITLLQGL